MPAHLIAEEGPYRGLIFNLSRGQDWIIGRDPDEAAFVIEDSTVSRKAAKLTRTEEGIVLKNLSKVNPTLVNGEGDFDSLLLKEGDRVQIGNSVFLFSEKPLPETGAPPKKQRKKKSAYDDIFSGAEPPPPEEIPEKEEEAPEELPSPSAESHAYDTIFEDEGSEELPFNLISENPFLLKVISGPNAGAEIGIDKGRVYTIGKDPNTSDIVFQDLSVSRNHARLSLSPEGVIEIEDLGSKNGTVVNGTPIGEKRIITPQDLIALGTTVFMIIDREAPQETIYSPMVQSYEPPKTEEPEEEFASQKELPRETDWKKEPIPPKYLIAAGSFALIFLVVFLSFFSLFKSTGIEVVQKEPTDEIGQALKKFEDVQFSFNPSSGKLFLTGHVLTPVDYQELRYRLGQIDFIQSVEDTVVIDEYVWKMMNDVLSETPAWRGVSIHSPSPGKFVVNGYLPSEDVARTLSEYLTVNFPYLDRLENRVIVEDVLNTQLQSILSSHNFGAVTFQYSNGSVILSGKYSDKMEAEYKDLIKQLNSVNGVQSVKNFAVPTHPDQANIDLTQQYQITGSSLFDGRGYSVVLNGKIYTLGDRVDGMNITKIESNTILLEKDGLKYKIDYTR